jgi:3-ketoacyl-CoA synthase
MGDSEATKLKQNTKEEELEVKSYWYPDRKPDLEDIKTGLEISSTDRGLLYLLAIPVLVVFLARLWEYNDLYNFCQSFYATLRTQGDSLGFFKVGVFSLGFVCLLFVIFLYFVLKSRAVYLVDFETYDAPQELHITHDRVMERTRSCGFFDEESIKFQEKILYRTGLGNCTYVPPGVVQNPAELSMNKARLEAEMVMFTTVGDLLKKTKISAQDIDIVIVNCSLFNPTPSLAEMLINKFKLRHNIIAYNIAGMGCSAGVVSLDLAKDLLQAHRNVRALVVSTENITQNWYTGTEKGMLLSNTLFRMGGAAMLISNRWSDSWRAGYQLKTIVRVHKGAKDEAFKSVYQEEDAEGKRGVRISKDLMSVVGDALKTNLTILGPQVLPFTEQAKFVIDFLHRKISGVKKAPYVPDFKKCFQHFCIHAGGRAVIDGLEENLKLSTQDVEPSRATLYRYGNTSSSSIWYELRFSERMRRIKRGDQVWQIAFGSGFQCNSAVWVALKSS